MLEMWWWVWVKYCTFLFFFLRYLSKYLQRIGKPCNIFRYQIPWPISEQSIFQTPLTTCERCVFFWGVSTAIAKNVKMWPYSHSVCCVSVVTKAPMKQHKLQESRKFPNFCYKSFLSDTSTAHRLSTRVPGAAEKRAVIKTTFQILYLKIIKMSYTKH
jgi:hypothetical protein